MSTIFYIFAKPIGILLFWLYGLVGNYGVAIIILTVIVRSIMFPLYNSQMKQSAAMSGLQPKLQQLQKQYGADKEKYNQKVMEFYQKENINPARGCLPLIIQMPILLGLFEVLRNPLSYMTDANSILAIHESFLWIPDLSQPDRWVLPILAGITTYFSYKITASATPQAAGSMKIMQYIFPIMIVWWGRSFPAGLSMYWFVGTLYMCVQQKFVMSKIKKDQEKKNAERQAQEQYEKEHPELFEKKEEDAPKKSSAKKAPIIEEDFDIDEIESYDDYSDFYTEEELERMKKNKNKKKKQ